MEATNHEWSKEAYFAKAQIYAESMAEHEDSNWQFGLWSAFLLEMLIRAAVSSTSPVLVADSKDWNNLLYALGKNPKKAKFLAKSATITELIRRVESLCEDFTGEDSNFCASHIARRNSEIHTGDMPFQGLGPSKWLPTFYSVCQVLLAEIGETLEDLFGKEEAARAVSEVAALQDGAAASIMKTVAAHRTVWLEKGVDDQESARKAAEATSLRHFGHRAACPACESTALVNGAPAGEAKRTVEDDQIVERQVMKPESFHCIACGLKINGYSKLLAADLGDTYVSTTYTGAMDFFEVEVEEHLKGLFDDDNNEY